jgi:hypothetical protein
MRGVVLSSGSKSYGLELEQHHDPEDDRSVHYLKTLMTVMRSTGLFSEIGYHEFFCPMGWDGDGMENGREIGEITKLNILEFLKSGRSMLLQGGATTEDVDHWTKEIARELEESESLRRYMVWPMLWALRRQ